PRSRTHRSVRPDRVRISRRSVEDDGAVSVHEHPTLRMPGHGSGQNGGFDVLSALNEVRDRPIVVDPGDILFDDRTLVEVAGDVVSGGADDLHTAGMGLMIGLGPLEAGQERMVDVDDPAFEPVAQLGREDLHITGQHDELDVELIDEGGQPRLGGGLRVPGDRDVVEGMTVELGQGRQGVMVAGDSDDVDWQLTGRLLEQQRVEAVRGLGHEDECASPLLRRLQTHGHRETIGRLGELGFEGLGRDRLGSGELQAEEELMGVGGGELLRFGDVAPEPCEHSRDGMDDAGRIGTGDSQDPFCAHGLDPNRPGPGSRTRFGIRMTVWPRGPCGSLLAWSEGVRGGCCRCFTHHIGCLRRVLMTETSMQASLADIDPQIAEVLDLELGRQRSTLEMIASENFVPRAVLEAQGSVLTNKYAEGYPGKRYYGGCEYVDVAENLAIERAKSLFGAEYANVQPHSGASANAA